MFSIFLESKFEHLPSHDASDAVSESVSFWLWSFKMPVRAGMIITGNVPLNPIPNNNMFSAVVAENYRTKTEKKIQNKTNIEMHNEVISAKNWNLEDWCSCGGWNRFNELYIILIKYWACSSGPHFFYTNLLDSNHPNTHTAFTNKSCDSNRRFYAYKNAQTQCILRKAWKMIYFKRNVVKTLFSFIA